MVLTVTEYDTVKSGSLYVAQTSANNAISTTMEQVLFLAVPFGP